MMRTLSVVLTAASCLVAVNPSLAFDADINSNGAVTSGDCLPRLQMALNQIPSSPDASLDGDDLGLVTSYDVFLCKLSVLELRPMLDSADIFDVASGSELPLGAGLNLDKVTAITVDGEQTGATDSIQLPCTPDYMTNTTLDVVLWFEVNNIVLRGSTTTLHMTDTVDDGCAAVLGACVDPAIGCAGPCQTGECVETSEGYVCEDVDDPITCPSCPEGMTPGLDGSCEPADGSGGADPFMFFPITNSSVMCTTYAGHPQNGCDLAVPVGTAIGAPISGTVTVVKGGCADNNTALYGEYSPYSSCNGGAGNYLIIEDDQDRKVWIFHCKKDSITVVQGQRVCAGEQVALSGASGRVYSSIGGIGAHIHVGTFVDGVWIYAKGLWLDKDNLKLGSPCPDDPPGPVCGDGEAEGAEACDGTDMNGATCSTMGYSSGVLACSSACELDTSACCQDASTVKCSQGALVSFDSCGNPGDLVDDCADNNPCTLDGCQGTTCTHSTAANGTSCGGGKTCQNGVCGITCTDNAYKSCYEGQLHWYSSCNVRGSLADNCSDGNACTTDGCSGNQCTYSNVSNGTACGGGKECNYGSCQCVANDYISCYAGNRYYYDSCAVRGSLVQACNDGNSCTTDGCSGSQCTYVNKANGTSCGSNKECKSGQCVTASCPDGNGLYCGESVGKTSGTLYYCSNGSYTVNQVCSYGCQVNSPGTNDACKSPPGCPDGNGLYCASDGKTLQQCTNGSYSFSAYCASGCHVAPPGQNDYCYSGSCMSGNGLYCGQHIGLSSSKLYQCVNNKYTLKQSCSNSCHVAPPGQNDYCQ